MEKRTAVFDPASGSGKLFDWQEEMANGYFELNPVEEALQKLIYHGVWGAIRQAQPTAKPSDNPYADQRIQDAVKMAVIAHNQQVKTLVMDSSKFALKALGISTIADGYFES